MSDRQHILPEDWLLDGQEYEARGEYHAAKECYLHCMEAALEVYQRQDAVPLAFYLLAALYEGPLAPTDPELILSLYRKAAEAGLPEAMLALGTRYLDGSLTPQDYEQAEHWLREAISAFGAGGDEECKRSAVACLAAVLTLRGDPEAREWIMLLAENGGSEPDRPPFLLADFHPADLERVLPLIMSMWMDGFRVWYSMEDARAAELPARLNGCSAALFFLNTAFLSSEGCLAELNEALKQDKSLVLVYLEELALPRLLAMRLEGRAAVIKLSDCADPDAFLAALKELPALACAHQ